MTMAAWPSGERTEQHQVTILTLGESLGVCTTRTGDPLLTARSGRLGIAGAESTVAVGLSRLGHQVSWLGVVGEDTIGRRIVRELRAEGVGVGAVRTSQDAATAFMLRERRTAERTRIIYYRAGSAGSQLSGADVDRAFELYRPTLVHLSGITPALGELAEGAFRRAVERALGSGAEVSLDINLRTTLPNSERLPGLLDEVLPDVDLLFVGDDEMHAVTDEHEPHAVAVELLRRGAGEVVVKRGAAGAIAANRNGSADMSARLVTVVDIVGAGDCFVAGYLAAHVEQRPLRERLEWGVTCAAFGVASDGDWEGLPNRAELLNFEATEGTVR